MHNPVLLNEVISFLGLQKGQTVVDATINGGGHAMEILKNISPCGKMIGIDQDEGLLEMLKSKLGNKLILINGNFRNIRELVVREGIEKVDSVLFDLGMSSFHLDKAGRGFSFGKNEPLIMNYKIDLGLEDLTAGEILNKWPEQDVKEILWEYGEERYAPRIARSIVEYRKNKFFENTDELTDAIRKVVPPHYRRGRINCATRTFQALRIAVNDELNVLNEGLSGAWELVASGGRIVVISFHSLEDRIVKVFFREKEKNGEGKILTKKPVMASMEEIKENPRARSAKMRAVLKK